VRSASLLTVVSLLAAPLVLVAPPAAGAASSHAPVRVPDVTHMTKSAVYAAMSRAGLYFHTTGPGSSNGRWVSALGVRPRAGTVVPWHSTVTVLTSLQVPIQPGHVPNVIGMTKTQVNAAMAKADLYYQTTGPGSANGTWVRVVGQKPRAGTAVAARSTVTLTTSTTRAHRSSVTPAGAHVPNVIGMTKAQVNAAMAKADLYYQTTGPGSANGTWVRVVGQKPRAGTAVAARSTVTLTTSSARARATTRAEVRVPNVVHLTKAQVIRVFKKDGLTLRATGPGSANGTWVRVVGQSPRAGTKITRHGVVTLTTTRARTPRPTTTSPPTTSTAPTSSSTTSSLPGSSTDVTTTSPTTTSPPTTTTTTTQKVIRRRPHRYRVGVATWYSYIPGRCATSYLPMGTRVTVRDLASGRTIHCVVTDRQAVSSGRVVDLSETQFSLLAPLWRGVVRVKVSW